MSPRTRWSPPEQKARSPWPVSTITPTCGSSRAASSARLELHDGLRAERVADLGAVDRDLRDPVAAELVADVLVRRRRCASRRRGGSSSRAGRCRCSWTREASFRGVEVEAWLPRAAAAHPRRIALGTLEYAALLSAAQRAARRAERARRRARATASRSRCPPGEDFARRAARLPPARRRGGAARPAPAAASEAARRAAGCAATVDGPLDGEEDPGAPLTAVHDLDAPAAIIHTSGTSADARPITLTYGNWLWSALGSAVALGSDPRRALALLPAGRPRRRPLDPHPLRDRRNDGDPPRAPSTPTPCSPQLRDPAGPTLVSLVPATLTRLLDAGLREPPALRWALLGGAAIPDALLERAAEAGVPVAPTYGMTEACSQVADERRAAVLHARERSATTGRSSSPARPCRRPSARCSAPVTSAAASPDGRITVLGPRRRRDHQRRRERRAAGRRGGARARTRRSRRRRSTRARTTAGGRPSSRPSSCATAHAADEAALIAHCRADLAAVGGPEGDRVRRRAAAHAPAASCCAARSDGSGTEGPEAPGVPLRVADREVARPVVGVDEVAHDVGSGRPRALVARVRVASRPRTPAPSRARAGTRRCSPSRSSLNITIPPATRASAWTTAPSSSRCIATSSAPSADAIQPIAAAASR